MGEKDTILSKLNIKDYRNDLELVLEDKNYDEEAKSLLLSVFYKIDNFYKDYLDVKINAQTKNDFIENYIKTIKDNCNEIKILSPKDFNDNHKYDIDKDMGTITCFPNEMILLFALFELSERKLKDDELEFINKCILDMLNKANTINNTEPVRDFNGWSWNVEINNPNNMNYNLIFQNLLILFGYEFVNIAMKSNNPYEMIKKEAAKKFSDSKAEQIINCISQIALGLYNNKSIETHKECVNSKENVEAKIETLKNRKGHINYVSKNNNALIKKIEKIDMILSDYDLIKKEFSTSVLNNDGKYFCISDVVDKYELERNKLIKNVEENNELISPKRYLEIQDNYHKRLKLYDQIIKEKNKVNIQNKILDFQKLFLECKKSEISKDETKKDMLKIVSEMRYYNNLPYEKSKRITLQDGIDSKFEEISRLLIYELVKERIADIGFRNKDLCYNILKYIYDTKIMRLDNMVLKIKFKNQSQIEVEYFDGNVLDHQEVFSLPFDEEITSTKNRKVKLF